MPAGPADTALPSRPVSRPKRVLNWSRVASSAGWSESRAGTARTGSPRWGASAQ